MSPNLRSAQYKMKISKFVRWPLKIVAGLFLLIVIYFISAFGLSAISVHSDFKAPEKEAVSIYILTNGVHTDLVLPFQNEQMDWNKYVSPSATTSRKTTDFVAFGWGDKGFYLQTKTWDDLKLKTAFNALFYLSSTAMHVSFYNKLQEDKSCKKIHISKDSYQKLVEYVTQSFKLDSAGNSQLIEGAHYWDNDIFYEANRKYGLFFTCNTWANEGLKEANLKSCLWTPFDYGIFKQY
jgi:uncharacterized protein (TIGR02117 family)